MRFGKIEKQEENRNGDTKASAVRHSICSVGSLRLQTKLGTNQSLVSCLIQSLPHQITEHFTRTPSSNLFEDVSYSQNDIK